MSRFSRRWVLKAGAAGVGISLLSRSGLAIAQTTSTAVRYNARSPKGKEMLRIYAEAVAKMMQTPEGDPLSWTFQWYTHFVRGDSTKAKEISRIYGEVPSANKQLAEAMWDTCQAHSDGQNEDNFLPWHRMYVYYFEQIIRQVSGRTEFTLPYWDYTDPTQQALPDEFRRPGDPVYGSLYRSNRRIGEAGAVNMGVSITTAAGAAPSSLNLDAMDAFDYSGETGFCQQLDDAPHGLVHVYTGNRQGMGSVPWAANDPIFWLHHCNIDRIWASWNAVGRKNPTDADWKATKFTFAKPDGTGVQAAVGDFLEIAPLNYSYDVLLKPPSMGVAAAAASQAQEILSAGGGTLKTESFQAALARSGAAPNAPSIKTSAGKRRVYLKISGMSAGAQPGEAYNVYLDLPAGTVPSPQSPYYVGTLGFFDAAAHGEHSAHGDMKGAKKTGKTRILNITRQVAALQRLGKLSDNPKITLIPTGEPTEGSNPQVEQFSLLIR